MREYPYLAEALGQVLEIYRTKSLKTKTAIADFSGLERRYLREIERGAKKPTVNAVYSICEALEVSPVEFFAKVEAERLRLCQRHEIEVVGKIGGGKVSGEPRDVRNQTPGAKVAVKIRAVKTSETGNKD